MPNSHALVSLIARLDQPGERSLEEMLRSEPGFWFELAGGRRVRLDPASPRSLGHARLLVELYRLKRPVYVEIDPARPMLKELRIPLVGRVVGISPLDDRALQVELEPSQARHHLPLAAPDFADIEKPLREAMDTGQVVIVTLGDDGAIVHARAFTPGPDGPLPPLPLPRPKEPLWPRRPWFVLWLWRIWCWPWWPWRWCWWWCRDCLTLSRAQQVFDALAATSCDPLTVPAPCIPFKYPDDGCWARAHEMYRLMLAMGITSRKIWIDGNLHTPTRNNPNCFVDWGWHVAPTVSVCLGFFGRGRMVMDPSLFTTPVSEATWKGVQGDPGATLTDTDGTVFWHGGGGDPGYTYTDYYLAFYRTQLQNRALSIGPPPYSNCP
jgi:hypothetical protein